MKRSIILLVALLAPSSVFANSPDLCTKKVILDELGEPHTDSEGVMLSRFCVWTGPGAAVWDGDVCCTFDAGGASCDVPNPDTGECIPGVGPVYCEHGEPVTGGGFVCYQEFPDACEAGYCESGDPPSMVDAPDGSTEDVICCIGGTCWPWDDKAGWDCEGEFLWCIDGYSNVDGTVECFD